MKKRKAAVSVIGGADGPTSVFLIKKNQKLTWQQKLQKLRNKIKRTYVKKTLSPESHTLDEVMDYIVNIHGFVELSKDEIKEEYCQMRASFLMQYAPELLGEYAKMPQLKSESPEDIKAHLAQFQEREKKAQEIPTADFDIEFRKFQLPFEDRNNHIHIDVESRFGYIGGGASGDKKVVKKFRRIYKDVYRYYGVTKEDIESESKRYKDVIQTLSM